MKNRLIRLGTLAAALAGLAGCGTGSHIEGTGDTGADAAVADVDVNEPDAAGALVAPATGQLGVDWVEASSPRFRIVSSIGGQAGGGAASLSPRFRRHESAP